jgi:hypothetical protein
MEVELEYKVLKYRLNIDEKVLERYKEYHNPNYKLNLYMIEGNIYLFVESEDNARRKSTDS